MTGASGVVAAGHPATAEAGAWALREGGNAVDAAVAAVLTSFAAESPLTGLGAGGYMLIHDQERSTLLDFFVSSPGREGGERSSELVPAPVAFTPDVTQVFNIGAASCGVPGMASGLERALADYGTLGFADLVGPAVNAAREGVAVSATQAYIFHILAPILTREQEGAGIYAPDGQVLGEGAVFRWEDLALALERLAAEGAAPFRSGDVAHEVADWVSERGGTLGRDDFAAYEPVAREPVRARFRAWEVVTNPPPSSGGRLIALALEYLERQPECGVVETVAAMAEAQRARAKLDEAASRLGSTTHITALDGDGGCASVTCSNGTGSGLIVPGTGVHVNNMLGEEDLNPLGFHRWPPGVRLPSMMSPTAILRDGELVAGLGSAGSNRIRSAILQTIIRLLVDELSVDRAVVAPRLHFELGVLHAEPGVDEDALAALEARGTRTQRWRDQNMFFGGVQAVTRNPQTEAIDAAGDPRRGGAVAFT